MRAIVPYSASLSAQAQIQSIQSMLSQGMQYLLTPCAITPRASSVAGLFGGHFNALTRWCSVATLVNAQCQHIVVHKHNGGANLCIVLLGLRGLTLLHWALLLLFLLQAHPPRNQNQHCDLDKQNTNPLVRTSLLSLCMLLRVTGEARPADTPTERPKQAHAARLLQSHRTPRKHRSDTLRPVSAWL
jgi:hypothetical protein